METIELEGKILHLAFPDELKIPWIGDKQYLSQIHSVWAHERDSNQSVQAPFNPKIIGRTGMGKTTLAYSAAKVFIPNSPSEVFILHCSETLSPDQLLIHKMEIKNGVEYYASSLITAMLKGGICIVDECQYLSSESWAAISTLLDQRYIVSDIAGLKIYAQTNFRICFTQNFDNSNTKKKGIPKYISTLLKPVINLNHPSRKHELEVLKYFFPNSNPIILQHMVDFLQSAHFEERPYSIRDCINIIQRYKTLFTTQDSEEIDWNAIYQSIRQILDNQAIYFLNELLNQNKESDFLYKDDDMDFDVEDKDETSDLNDYYEDEENYAEFVEDEDLDDVDESFSFFEESEDKDIGENEKNKSSIPDAKYLKNVKKKIQAKLKKKKQNQRKRDL